MLGRRLLLLLLISGCSQSRDLPPLFRATNAGEVRAILESGENVDVRASDETTALFSAAAAGRSDVVEALLAAGAAVNATDQSGRAPLHFAADTGNAACAEALIQAGAVVDDRDAMGWTPLHVAQASGNTAVREVLLKNGADDRLRDSLGWTPAQVGTMFRNSSKSDARRAEAREARGGGNEPGAAAATVAEQGAFPATDIRH